MFVFDPQPHKSKLTGFPHSLSRTAAAPNARAACQIRRLARRCRGQIGLLQAQADCLPPARPWHIYFKRYSVQCTAYSTRPAPSLPVCSSTFSRPALLSLAGARRPPAALESDGIGGDGIVNIDSTIPCRSHGEAEPLR